MLTNEIKIKYGRPILKLHYDTLHFIMLCIIVLNVINVIYGFLLFSTATKLKRTLGDYISMVTYDGYVLPFLVSIPGFLLLPINVASIYFMIKIIVDSKTKRMTMNHYLFIFIIICLASGLILVIVAIIALAHSYNSHEKLHDGIRDAMDNYALNSLVKSQLDAMQITFQCCGSKKYTEWYEIKWFDGNFVDNSTRLFGGETPFSCCSMRSIFPCIHHGIETTKSVYNYHPDTNLSISVHGCHTILIKRKLSASWYIVGLLMLALVMQVILSAGLRLIQTAHHERGRLVEGSYVYTSWIIGWYEGVSRKLPPPVPPIPPELMN